MCIKESMSELQKHTSLLSTLWLRSLHLHLRLHPRRRRRMVQVTEVSNCKLTIGAAQACNSYIYTRSHGRLCAMSCCLSIMHACVCVLGCMQCKKHGLVHVPVIAVSQSMAGRAGCTMCQPRKSWLPPNHMAL